MAKSLENKDITVISSSGLDQVVPMDRARGPLDDNDWGLGADTRLRDHVDDNDFPWP